MSANPSRGLVAAARSGDEWALRAIYERFSPVARGYLRNQGVTYPDDLLGGIFLQMVRDLPRFDGEESALRTWILRLTHQRLVREGMRRPRRLSISLVREAGESEAASAPPADHGLDRKQRLRAVLDALPFDQRSVLLLRATGDLSLEQVAEVVGKSPRAVRRLQRRGLAALGRDAGDKPSAPSAPSSPAGAPTEEPAEDLTAGLRSLADRARRMEREAQAVIEAAERAIASFEASGSRSGMPPDARRVTAWREEALLRATQLAIQGRERSEIETALERELSVKDPTAIVDQILGPRGE